MGWYGSGYFLTTCAFQLLFGRIYTFYSPKTVYITSIFLFEVGSAICGAAPNSTAFIIGRAVAGLGGSGAFSGAIVIIMHTVPLPKRPIFQGLIGAIFGVSSVIGPLLGGVFTSKVSWRWCFYINLPIGGVAMLILFFILHLPAPKNANTPLRQQIAQLDPIGTTLFMPAVICLLLALQWGGSTYAWDSARIITLLVIAFILTSGFIAVQIWKKDLATVPPHIVRNRSMTAGMWAQFCSAGSMMVMIYYLPIWFQAIKAVSAVRSGIMNLPLILSLVVATIAAGFTVSRMGYYTPFMIAQGIIMSIGAGLITTFSPTTPHQQWIGYQFIFGFGLGLGSQQASFAAQACLEPKDAPTGVSLILFMMQLGGTVFSSIGQNVFANELVKGLRHVPGLENTRAVVDIGATELRNVVPKEVLPRVLAVYNGALVKSFEVALAMSCLSFLGSISMEWKNIKKDKSKDKATKGDAEEGPVVK